MNNENDDRTLKMSDVMRLTQYTDQTIRHKIKTGEIPAFKLGSRWRFSELKILQWIKSAQKGEVK
jgi:excisionase family DNA binding protein